MVASLTQQELGRSLGRLVSDRLIYFPVRHHSPACSWHLTRLIQAWKPNAILIEGPASFTRLIPLILDPRTRAPFAIYTSCTLDLPDLAGNPAPSHWLEGMTRHAAYYPFCNASPELVALREGHRAGAQLRFIDLDFKAQAAAEWTSEQGAEGGRVGSLLSERHLKRSDFIRELARRAGCRDHNDLWDHLFETRWARPNEMSLEATHRFIRDVGAWCACARRDATPEALAADGTAARESAMAQAIHAERQALAEGRILVVTGGFHSVALPDLVDTLPAATTESPSRTRKATAAKPGKNDVDGCLIRYGYEQLDTLNGYAAGMPSPGYYEDLWQRAGTDEAPTLLRDAAAAILVGSGQSSRRDRKGRGLSIADEIAALDQACRLAVLRGHPGPLREDLLDGIRSCFVKGSMDVEGMGVLASVGRLMTGTAVGEVPPEAGVPPIVDDFRTVAGQLRLNLQDSSRREVTLDLYRKAVHRRTSRFFRSLEFLNVPFARFVGGPDFVTGTRLELIQEHWVTQWIPKCESQLIEAGIHGATIEEACAGLMGHTIVSMEDRGNGRNALAAVALLMRSCLMGLHRHAGRLVALIETHVQEDPSLESLANALSQLVLLWESREPLEAHSLQEIPDLIRNAYERVCFHAQSLPDTAPDAAPGLLAALTTVRDLLRSKAREGHGLDPVFFHDSLRLAFSAAQCPPHLAGGIAGVLYGETQLALTELLARLRGFLNAASDQSTEALEFLIGLLTTARELAWREPALVESIGGLLESWSDEQFLQRIPQLRLAFSRLTPRETDRVAAVVAEGLQLPDLGSLQEQALDADEAIFAAGLNLAVEKALAADGLQTWGAPAEPASIPGGSP